MWDQDQKNKEWVDFKECHNCDGLGRIDDLNLDDDEDEDLDLSQINIICPTCRGRGYLEKE